MERERTDFEQQIDRLVADRMAFVAANRERLVEAWIAETGLKPSESMLVIQDTYEDGVMRTTVRVERRTDRECSCGRPLSPGKCSVCDRDE